MATAAPAIHPARVNGVSPANGLDNVQAAREAGLRYVTDAEPGIRRLKSGRGVRYVGPEGEPIRDASTLARIESLVIPPAWTDVWICPSPRGHIQATGRDAAGRKQYRYHPKWRATRDETKYDRMVAFGQALPVIRHRVREDLAGRALSRERVLATAVSLLERTMIRVGNEEYARTNRSFGLTTLRDRHVAITGGTIRFRFRGKSGKEHEIDIRDPRLARIVKRCRDLPGQTLFQYLDDDGVRHTIGSADVNAYLHEVAGSEFSAKDFRTWAGTLLACQALVQAPSPESKTAANQAIVQAVDAVAAQLGNTRAVCRRCYIHPAVLEAYEQGTLGEAFAGVDILATTDDPALSPCEQAMLAFLETRRGAGGTLDDC